MNGSPPRLAALDALRGLTILWVAVMHFGADVRGLPGPEVAPMALWARLSAGDPIGALGGAIAAVVFLPGTRLDLLLFVTGLVLSLGQPLPALALWRRRARAILPGYWLGTVMVAGVLVALAALRSWVGGIPFPEELHAGSRLAGAPYGFRPSDVLVSATVVGRFQRPDTVQIVSPSLWYIALVVQLYVAYPMMRWTHARLGTAGMVAACTVVMLAARVVVLTGHSFGGFDSSSAFAAFLPFRLLSPALGMAAAPWFLRHAGRLGAVPHTVPALGVALLMLLVGGWLAAALVPPVALALVVGPSLAVPPLVAGLWIVVSWALARPPIGRLLVWAGQTSLALLVVQDALRFAVGTTQSLGLSLAPWLWPLLPPYLALALGLTWCWAPVPRLFADLIWPIGQRPYESGGTSPAAIRRIPGATGRT